MPFEHVTYLGKPNIRGGFGGALGAWRGRRGAKDGAKRTPGCADPVGGTPKFY